MPAFVKLERSLRYFLVAVMMATAYVWAMRTARVVPTFLHFIGVERDDEHGALVRRKLAVKLGKFASSIERVDVRVYDVNGPRGGVDQACRINVALGGLTPVVFEHRADSVEAAMDGAVTGVERAVRRRVQRRRMKPLRGRPGAESA